MTLVTASVKIAAPPQRVWDVVMDPRRLGEWVTIHRRLDHADSGPPHVGFQVDQTLALAGAHFRVHWILEEHEPPRHATWEGRGPARSHARTTYRLAKQGDGHTRFDYENEFRPPGGPLGAIAARALVSGISQREANRTLQRLKALLERT
jgi:uncharacterized protein YndB with AHSA1/START domain